MNNIINQLKNHRQTIWEYFLDIFSHNFFTRLNAITFSSKQENSLSIWSSVFFRTTIPPSPPPPLLPLSSLSLKRRFKSWAYIHQLRINNVPSYFSSSIRASTPIRHCVLPRTMTSTLPLPPPSTSSRYDRCNFVVDWDVVAIAIERWAVHGFSGYPKLLRYVNTLEFRVLFEQERLFLKKKIIIIIYMNTKKFVAMDSTIHYLQSFEKKMESWKSIWKFKNGNFKI